jgi:hypothetical protein
MARKEKKHFSQPLPLLVTFDQNFERLEIPALRSSAEGQVAFVGKTVDRSNRRLFLVDALCEFGRHNSAPSLELSIRPFVQPVATRLSAFLRLLGIDSNHGH